VASRRRARRSATPLPPACGLRGYSSVCGGQEARKCHFFNSFFYKRLLTSATDRNIRFSRFKEPAALAEAYKNVKRWTKGVDLFDKVRAHATRTSRRAVRSGGRRSADAAARMSMQRHPPRRGLCVLVRVLAAREQEFVFVPINEHLHWSLIVMYRPGTYLEKLGVAKADAADDDATDEDEDDADAPQDNAADETSAAEPEAAPPSDAAFNFPAGIPDDHDVESSEPEDDVEDEQEVEEDMAPSGEDEVEERDRDTVGRDEYDERGVYCAGGHDEHEHGERAPEDPSWSGAADGAAAAEQHDDDIDDDVEEDEGFGRRAGGGASARVPAAGGTSMNDALELSDDDDSSPPPPPREPRQPCIMYIDSLGGSKSRAYSLLKSYLHLEHKEKKEKKKDAKPDAAADAPDASASASRKRARSEADGGAGARDADSLLAGDGVGSGDDEPSSSPPLEHLFKDYEEQRVEVEHQHNGVDCGLYMLKYIEKLAKHRPDLASNTKRPRDTVRWADHADLRITDNDIEAFRIDMRHQIEELAEKQKAQQPAKRAKSE
jgi:Ulp1 family protease